MANFKLVIQADAELDLIDIYLDGYQRWGKSQADSYQDTLMATIRKIQDNPFLYQAVDEIKAGYRRGISGKHSIYYRFDGETVEVMALIKHQNRLKR